MMYPYLLKNIIIIEGPSAFGVYDLNYGKFYRVNKKAGKLLTNLHGIKSIDSFNENERIFLKQANNYALVSFQRDKLYQPHSILSECMQNTSPLRFAWIEITGRCNQNCLHCFMGNDLNSYSYNDKYNIFRYIDELYSQGISQLILSGGEPTLHPDFESILDYAAKYNINLTLLTNGTTNQITKLREYRVKTKLSILGWGNTHDKIVGLKGAFSKVRNTVENFIKENAPIELGMTVCSLNLNDVYKVRQYANHLKLALEVSPIYPLGKALDNFDVLFRHPQRDFIEVCQGDKNFIPEIRSYAPLTPQIDTILPSYHKSVDLHGFLTNSFECGQKIVAILANGKVSPCILLRDKKYYLGDLQRESLCEILNYNNNHRQTFNKRMLLSNVKICANC